MTILNKYLKNHKLKKLSLGNQDGELDLSNQTELVSLKLNNVNVDIPRMEKLKELDVKKMKMKLKPELFPNIEILECYGDDIIIENRGWIFTTSLTFENITSATLIHMKQKLPNMSKLEYLKITPDFGGRNLTLDEMRIKYPNLKTLEYEKCC